MLLAVKISAINQLKMKIWEIYFNLRKPPKNHRPNHFHKRRKVKKKIRRSPSVHSGLEFSRRDLVRLDDVNDGAPSRTRVAVERVGERLRGRLEDLLGTHVLGPQSFTHALKFEMKR